MDRVSFCTVMVRGLVGRGVGWFLLLILIGCGGITGPNIPAGIGYQVTIDWPARTRDVTSPASALSAVIQLGSSASFSVNRPDTPTATIQTYTSSVLVDPGTYALSVTFYSLEDGSGQVVGSASGTVTVGSSGGVVGAVTTAGKITAVAVESGLSVQQGSQIRLTADCTDNQGNLVSVSPGSITWSGSGSVLTFTPDGLATGASAGTATVQATVDGITSPQQTVTVTQTAVNCGNSVYTPNYVVAMETSTDPNFQGTLYHWASFPLTVAFVSNANFNANFQTLAIQAMNSWANATKGGMSYTIVSSTATADVTIAFVPSAQIVGGDAGTVGLTNSYTTSTGSTQMSLATIQIASDLDDNTQTLNTIAHEFGHALGIEGHSQSVYDLMYYELNDAYAPAVDDTNTLLTDYCGVFPTSRVRRSRGPINPIPTIVKTERRTPTKSGS